LPFLKLDSISQIPIGEFARLPTTICAVVETRPRIYQTALNYATCWRNWRSSWSKVKTLKDVWWHQVLLANKLAN
jgi:hypothetical protein